MNKQENKYIDPKINGKLFPSWIMKNFKQYEMPPFTKDDEDKCNKSIKQELRSYQTFLSKYLDYMIYNELYPKK